METADTLLTPEKLSPSHFSTWEKKAIGNVAQQMEKYLVCVEENPRSPYLHQVNLNGSVSLLQLREMAP